jgi:uncharacterized membrane protein HdeD (DUF308 family)
MAQDSLVAVGRSGSSLSIVWGVLLVMIGMVAIGSPLMAAVAVSVIVAWLIILAGVIHVVIAFHAHGAGNMIWKLLVGIAYLCFGGYMLVHPVMGVASLTLVLAALFVLEGVLNLVLYFKMRPVHGSSWLLVDGIITLLVGLMIYLQWPSSSAWAIGVLVGASLIISGITRLGMTFAVRRATAGGVTTTSRLAA